MSHSHGAASSRLLGACSIEVDPFQCAWRGGGFHVPGPSCRQRRDDLYARKVRTEIRSASIIFLQISDFLADEVLRKAAGD